MSTAPIHVAAYRFVALPDAAAWRERIAEAAGDLGVVGTVLVAEEGINLALAGAPAAIDVFLGWLQEEERFAGLGVHRTRCAVLPYRRLRVRHKPEIIRMNQADVRPQDGRAPSVAPRTLRRWLAAGCDDAGREVMLLDTRNSFEVERGRFHNARHWSLARFSDLPLPPWRTRRNFAA